MQDLNTSVSEHSIRVRILHVLALAIPSTTFLFFRNSKNIGMIYVALIHARNAALGAILFFAGKKLILIMN